MNNIILEKTGKGMELELVIGKKDGTIDNASIPIRWCLTKGLLEHINGSNYRNPQILIQVTYLELRAGRDGSGDQDYVRLKAERHLFPLEQFVGYVPLSRAGRISIDGYLVGIEEGEHRCYERGLLAKDSYNSYLFSELGGLTVVQVASTSLRKHIKLRIIASAQDHIIKIPDNIFGAKPADWLYGLINRYYSNEVEDQCQLRRRYLVFPITICFIIIELLLRVGGIVISYTSLILLGFDNINTYYFRHPLTYWMFCFKGDDRHHFINDIDWGGLKLSEGLRLGFIILHRILLIPLILIPLAYYLIIKDLDIALYYQVLLSALIPTILFLIVALIILLVIVAVILISIFEKWYRRIKILTYLGAPFRMIGRKVIQLILKLEDWEVERTAKKIAKREKYLTCNNDPQSVTAEVDKIPLWDRTPTLIYDNIKNKVCKPIAR